jgi:hypothetical protein
MYLMLKRFLILSEEAGSTPPIMPDHEGGPYAVPSPALSLEKVAQSAG